MPIPLNRQPGRKSLGKPGAQEDRKRTRDLFVGLVVIFSGGILVFLGCRFLYSLTPFAAEAKRQEEAQDKAIKQAKEDEWRRILEASLRSAQDRSRREIEAADRATEAAGGQPEPNP